MFEDESPDSAKCVEQRRDEDGNRVGFQLMQKKCSTEDRNYLVSTKRPWPDAVKRTLEKSKVNCSFIKCMRENAGNNDNWCFMSEDVEEALCGISLDDTGKPIIKEDHSTVNPGDGGNPSLVVSN